MRSPNPSAQVRPTRAILGRRLSLPEAAAFLGMTSAQLYGLVRRRQITAHRVMYAPPAAPRRGRPANSSGYFFFEDELRGWIDATRVEADSPAVRAAVPAPDLSAFMPERRRFA